MKCALVQFSGVDDFLPRRGLRLLSQAKKGGRGSMNSKHSKADGGGNYRYCSKRDFASFRSVVDLIHVLKSVTQAKCLNRPTKVV